MTTRYGRSPWVERIPSSRVPAYPSHRANVSAEVAIVGGGLTGCATAYAFAAAGIEVALLEAGRLGRGGSGSSSGWMSDDPGARFLDVERVLKLRATRHAWRSWRRASLDFAALVRRLRLKCDLEPKSTVLLARTPHEVAEMKRDQKARMAAGLDISGLSAKAIMAETGIDAAHGVRLRGGATANPYRLTIGLARAAQARGALLFERSQVRRIQFKPKHVDVTTAGGTLRAERVIVATGTPTGLFKSLKRHVRSRSRFFALTEPVPAKIRRQLGRRASVVRDGADPAHTVRWVGDDQLLVSGADSELVTPRSLEKTVFQRTGQLMYELSTIYPDISGLRPSYGWEAAYGRTASGLPAIGAHRNFPRHLFAFGDSSDGMTGAYLASRILLRHHTDELEPADHVFQFNR